MLLGVPLLLYSVILQPDYPAALDFTHMIEDLI
jgi:hypothetical protein